MQKLPRTRKGHHAVEDFLMEVTVHLSYTIHERAEPEEYCNMGAFLGGLGAVQF
ncbi:MAG: hypothetical protein PWQ79_2297 [Thermococcaceae archaeon]|nr:hypothetical protein [Thermococcaceae archaeon]MDK2915382.1 hypothetical protein [Thermococcaceae archaeon]